MPFPPSLFLIGAQKAGTTYLASLLGQHPGICLSEPKEPEYFTRHWKNGVDWYRGCFNCPDRRLLLDASPSYSAAPLEPSDDSPLAGVPDRIKSLSPDARFIYLMRDPVKRTYSGYWHAVRAGDEKRPFERVIREDEYALRMGCYYEQVRRYLEHFPRDRFLFLFFEEFVKAPEDTTNLCLQWLDLPPVDTFELQRGKNETFTFGPLVSALDQLLQPIGGVKRIAKSVKTLLPHTLLRGVREALTKPIPPISEADREWLAQYFVDHNRALETELGLALPNWTRPGGAT